VKIVKNLAKQVVYFRLSVENSSKLQRQKLISKYKDENHRKSKLDLV
jgi:hypothetical protein